MKTVCNINQCAGCMACIDICPKNAIKIEDQLDTYNAVINEEKCVNCNLCHKTCQENNPPILQNPTNWYQGWANQTDVRQRGSSGGLATAITKSFIENKGIVYSCTFKRGQFIFECATKVNEISKFAGSKYVKSNPKGVYNNIRKHLHEGQKVLFIGLPCQVAALKNFINQSLQKNLYTIDLICHGSPSPKILEKFLEQYNYKLSELKDIKFRKKMQFQLYKEEFDGNNKYTTITINGVIDRYLIAFLNGICYTENCYNCKYAQNKRVSDITLGDSWGSTLPENEHKKGISLILNQSSKGEELIQQSDLHIEDVDIEKAIAKNHQLKHPTIRPKERIDFFNELKNNKNFNKIVEKYYPKQCYKQEIKKILIRLKLWNK